MPAEPIKDATLDTDLISTVKKEIKEPMHYAARSLFSSTLYDIPDDQTLKASTLFHQEQNPKTYKVAQKLKESI